MSGRGPVCEQEDLGHQFDTIIPEQNNQNSTITRKRKNRKWSKEQNMFIMEYYFLNPSWLKYRKRMLELRSSKSLFFITAKRFPDQAKNFHNRVWLTEIEREEKERKIKADNGNKNDTDSDNVKTQEANTATMSEEELSIEQVDETP